MNPIWTQLIIRQVLKHANRSFAQARKMTPYRQARILRELKIQLRSLVKDSTLIALGIGAAAFGLEGFLLPNNFIDGGVTGISLLATEITSVPLPVLLFGINLPFIFLGWKVIGKQFALKTGVAIMLLAVCISTVPFPEITHDKLLVAVFGGFFIGAGIGLSIRGGAVLDGTEVLAIFLSRKLRTTIGDFIILFNIAVFLAAAWLLSVESALYSMITYLSASKTLDFIIEGIEEYTGVTIISPHSERIREMVTENIGRGVTIYKGKGGYGKRGMLDEIDILYTVITRLELNKLHTEIEKIDPNAFVVASSVKEIKGGMIRKRPLQH